jgi:hypothetical protein
MAPLFGGVALSASRDVDATLFRRPEKSSTRIFVDLLKMAKIRRSSAATAAAATAYVYH